MASGDDKSAAFTTCRSTIAAALSGSLARAHLSAPRRWQFRPGARPLDDAAPTVPGHLPPRTSPEKNYNRGQLAPVTVRIVGPKGKG